MKKLILVFLFFAIAMMGAKAQLGGGYDAAFNFGGGGTTVKNVVRTSNGDTYFYATIMGRAFFAGQEIDGGAYGTVPQTKGIFGKVSSAGTQTLLKLFDFGASRSSISATGELIFTTDGNAGKTTDYGNGVTNNAWGFYMVKFNNTGIAQWIKKIATGTDVEYGNGIADPTTHGLTSTPDGSIFLLVDANSQVATAPYLTYKYPHRVIKFDANGDEVWHNEFFSSSYSNGFKVPEQFVSDNGSVTFGILINSKQWYVNGEDISSQMSNYANSIYSIIISLKPDGTKNFYIADTQSPVSLVGVNPATGDLHVGYANANLSVFPNKAPFSTLPNYYPNTLYTNYYLFNGTLKFSNAGVYQNFVLAEDAKLDKLIITSTGFVGYEDATANNVVDKGDYGFSSAEAFGVISYYDASFNFIKAIKTSKLTTFSVNGDKTSMGGTFKGNLIFGSTTLTQSSHDTDFDTRFPAYKSLKNDIFIATADVNNITPPAQANWLGVDNNWNNVANWSTGVVPDAGTDVRLVSQTVNMPTTGVTPKAFKLTINAGVIAELPNNLAISKKVIINGKLQINHTGALAFSGYAPGTMEGVGTIAFNGSNTPSVNSTSLTYTGLTLETNEDMYFLYPPGLNKLKFTGTNAVIKLNGNNLDITSPDEDAITGYSETNLIEGGLTRAVNANGTYVFPGKVAGYTYEPATLTLNNLQGISKVKAEFKASSKPNYTFPDASTTAIILGDGYSGTSVKFTTDAVPSAGTYSVSLQKSKFTNGVLEANKERYVVLMDGKFQGTKLASTQTGGTINGQTVSNALVTAGVDNLSKFGEFLIGINSALVPIGTAVTTATWIGNINGEWNTAGNWSSGVVPNGLTDVTIPVSMVYPSVYGTTDFVNSLTINSGVVNMSLSHILGSNLGITNNGDIKIEKLAGANTTYSGGTLGTGKARFEANSGLTVVSMGTSNDVEINIGNTNSLEVTGNFSGNFNVKSGKITAQYSSNPFAITNPNSVVQITAAINGVSNESYIQTINPDGTYFFPLISSTRNQSAIRNYGGMTITNHGITNTKKYTARFESYFKVPVSIVNGSDFYSGFLNSGQWYVTMDYVSPTGTVDVSFTTSGYTNGGRTNVSDYVLLRRASGSIYENGIPWVVVSGATISESAGTLTATANGIPAFNSAGVTFCIGLKAGITTWTGTKDMNWNDVANWNNGLPSSELKAIIGNAGRYPSNPPTSGTNQPALIEIASGSVVSLPATFSAPTGIINNGTIKVVGTAGSTFTGFLYNGSPVNISGTGKLVFDANSPGTFDSYYMGYIIGNGIEVNNPAGLTLNRTTTFTGDVNLVNGKITMGTGLVFTMSNPDATISGSANAYINGMLKRKVNPTGTYNFPVGIAGAYAPASLSLNGLTGTTDITTNFSDATVDGQPNLTIGNATVSNLLAGGSWTITPNAQPSAGNYGTTLSAPLGSSTANSFYILKRGGNYSFYTWENQGTNAASSVTAGVVTASATGITSFSQFGIGEGVGTLPVKLITFLASAGARSAKLYWETASELNNDKFEIERSVNGIDFVKIGEVKGNGTSQKLNTYSFRDLAPANGVNYYRLKQFDFNGKSEYGDIKFVNFNFSAIAFSVYPNPATGVINFSEEVKSVAVYNLQGLLVLQQNGLASSVNIPNTIASGLYLLKLKLAGGNSVTKQVIITK